MKLNLFIFLCFALLSCSTKKKKIYEEPKIFIEVAESYKYDLKNEIYTVFFMGKPSMEIKFHLTEDEKLAIKDRYYDLRIDEIQNETSDSAEIFFEDECRVMPKMFTIVVVRTRDGVKRIKIDEDCDDFMSNSSGANSVKRFIDFVRNILRRKQEIRDAPLSNILYI